MYTETGSGFWFQELACSSLELLGTCMVGVQWQGFLQLNWARSPPLGCFEAASSWFVRMAVVLELLLFKREEKKKNTGKPNPLLHYVTSSSASLVDLGNNDLQNLIRFSVFHSSCNPDSLLFLTFF